MKILVVGGGGREHALVWRLAVEPGVSEVLCAPGNAGTARTAKSVPVDAGDVDAVLAAAEREGVDLTVVGPELPLDRGIVDQFSSRGLRILGPSRAAARLECSKAFAKRFMERHRIPTARYRVCDRVDEARAVIASAELGFPLVVKADGLASGKGVVVCADRRAAEDAVGAALADRQFGDAGSRLVLEECLTGPEVSFFVLCDGTTAVPLGSAQDHKRAFDNDEGPNTGGMGALAPSPLVDAATEARIMREIVRPVLAGMREEGHEFRGFLYAGLMLTGDGPKVIEFNVRFGDPEAQVVIPMIAPPLVPHLMAAAEGGLEAARLDPPALRPEKHVGVVVAAREYPTSGSSGVRISGLEAAARLDDVLVFHSGTAVDAAGAVVTAGGRILTVVGRGPSYDEAIARAYAGVKQISFHGMRYRTDIGRTAIQTRTTVQVERTAPQ